MDQILRDIIELRQRADQVNEIIKRCEKILDDDISDFHKDLAKAAAYDEIVKIWEGRD